MSSDGSPFIEVAFNLPLPGSYTYASLPDKPSPVGSRVIAPFGRRSLAGFVTGTRETPPPGFQIKQITRVVNNDPLFDADYLTLADWVCRMYFSSLGETLAAMIPSGRRETDVPGLGVTDEAPSVERLNLSEEQHGAIDRVFGQESGLFYLFGITGSGKTEVFLQAAERTIAAGRSVIYLVPEIALTHQLLDSVRHRFHGQVAVLHSRLTPSQRLTEWQRIRRGDAPLVIGARSAVFAPTADLGLVVLDEEHDGSYKSGSAPRYHARQVAMKRIGESGGRMMMGSATPSVEAWHLMESDTLVRIPLTQRLSGGAMPKLTAVDLSGQDATISTELLEAMKQTHADGRQTILFLNRRGFAYFFHCRSCGFEMKCQNCSVGLTYHKNRNVMVCHYCGFRANPVDVCPECGSLDVGYSGFGTERVQEELERRFPDWVIRRVDSDSVRRKGALEEAIDDFRGGKTDVLLGTQMVAKGLNFPGVRLVGIILADTGLHLPDFRAAERTFSLIVQVAGRAGRFHPDGEVVVQTFAPDNPAIHYALRHDLESFYARELAARRDLGFPPYARLIRLLIRGASASTVMEVAADLAQRCRAASTSGEEILGPSECPLSVVKGNVRHQIIVRTNRFNATHRALENVLLGFEVPRKVHLEIDVDPVALL